MSKICVLGQGYIGLPTALLFANNFHEVMGIDVNKRVIETLKIGKMPFEENGFQELLDEAIAKKAYSAEYLVEEADVFLVAVPTPFDSEMRMADLKYVISACEMIVPHLRKGNRRLESHRNSKQASPSKHLKTRPRRMRSLHSH